MRTLTPLFLLATVQATAADQLTKVPRIGFVTAGSPSSIAARIEALRQGLRELGYTEDKNIVIEWRFAQGKPDRLPALVAELVNLHVDVILSAGAAVTRPAKDATRTIPIVMTQDTDPVGNGFVASLARPGGNITGLSSYSAELNGKRLELLKEIVPKLSRLTVVGTSTYPGNALSLKETELAARAMKVHLHYSDVLDAKDIETAFKEANKVQAEGVLVLQSNILNSHRKRATDLATKHRVPVIYYAPEFLDAGDGHDHDHHHHDHDHHHHDHDHAHSHGGLKHYHDEEMQSLSLRSQKPLDASKFMPWLQNLVASEGQKILRSKGILAFSDDDDRYVFQGVHMMLEGDHQRAWKDGEPRESRLVFIGRELPEQMIRDGFENCIA